MFASSGFTWFNWLPLLGDDSLFTSLGIDVEPGTGVLFAHAMTVCLLLVGLAVLGRMALERQKARPGLEKYFAEPRFNLRTALEIFANTVIGVMSDMLSKDDVKKFFPLVASLFLYIFLNNFYGMIPGFAPPTDNVNTNVGMAIGVFVLFNVVGLWRDPVGYVKHLAGPMLVVAPLLFTVEVIGLIFRPVTLSLRLTGNIFGDHTVFSVISELAPPVIPALILGLGLFVSFMQAFIFALLTTMYVAMAVPAHDDHGEAHH
jgi:F-type H+-transporting ATPase subunit a